MNEHSKNGAVLQILQTILVAVLLGVTGWLANATIQNREVNVRVQTQLEERTTAMDRESKAQDAMQSALQDIQREQTKTEYRLRTLEKGKNP